MANERVSILTEAAQEAAQLIDEVIEELKADPIFGIPMGMEATPSRMLRATIRRALVGDEQAMIAIAQMAVDNGHQQDGDDCPVCREVAEVAKEWQP
jgi:hypothetical protein